MGLISRLFFGTGGGAAPLAAATGGMAPTGTGILSPWADSSSLAKIAYSELFGSSTDIVDRKAAMTVAPIKRGRAIICGSLSDLPLVAGRFTGVTNGSDSFKPVDRQPAWLSRTRTVVTTWHRMSDTIDDLIFHGWSLWALERSEAGTILDALRVPRSQWDFDDHSLTGIKVRDQPILDSRSVMLIQGPDDGVLATGAEIIRGWRAIERGWVTRVRTPAPLLVLHEVEGNGLYQDEAQKVVDTFIAARRSDDGAVAFLPAGVNLEEYGQGEADMYVGARNAARLDVANLLNLPASVLDGSTATASLTYQTAQGEFSQLSAWLEYWLAPIEARLSMDDITPQGQVIRFDRRDLSINQTFGPGVSDDAPIEEIAA